MTLQANIEGGIEKEEEVWFTYRTATIKISHPRIWHIPLPHILHTNQSNGKSQTNPHKIFHE
jgi:hypothetical protein